MAVKNFAVGSNNKTDLDLLHSPRGPTQIIPERSPASWNWEFESTAVALEESADAYVWLLPGRQHLKTI